MKEKVWSKLPEDAGPWYIWRHMSDGVREYYRKEWVRNSHLWTDLRRQRLRESLEEWYEEAFESYYSYDLDDVKCDEQYQAYKEEHE